jgi:membrane protease YdiL (CAAX protease family)
MSYEFKNLFIKNAHQFGKNSFGRYLMGIFIILSFYIAGGVIATAPLISNLKKNGYSEDFIRSNKNIIFDSDAVDYDINTITLLQFFIFIVTFLAILIVIKIHQRRLLSFITSENKFRWNYFFFATYIWGVFNLLVFLNSYLFERENLILNFRNPDFFYMIPILLVCIPIQTFVEEFVYRSYLLQGLSYVFKNSLPAIIISAALFSLSHASNPEIKAFGFEVMLLFYFIFGLTLGYLTILTKGIEVSWGIHMIHNLLSGILITSENSVLKTNALFITLVQNAWSELIFVTAGLAFFILILINKFKLSISFDDFK